MLLQGAAAMAADSLASLVSTAWVGRLGSEQLAAVGVASSLYLAATKLVNTPLLIVSVSTIAAALGQEQDARKGRQSYAVVWSHLPVFLIWHMPLHAILYHHLPVVDEYH